jgi:flagellar biogenesis protein FliO
MSVRGRQMLIVVIAAAGVLLTPAQTAAQPSGEALRSTDDLWQQVEPPAATREDQPVRRRAAEGRASSGAPAGSTAWNSWLRTSGALAGVIGLIVLLAWGQRVVANRGWLSSAGRPTRPGTIEIISRVTLSARQSLCLVRVGPRLVLLGLSGDSVRALDVVADEALAARLAGEALQRRAGSSAAEFARCLESEARQYAAPDSTAVTTGDARETGGDELRLARARRRLSEALDRARRWPAVKV